MGRSTLALFIPPIAPTSHPVIWVEAALIKDYILMSNAMVILMVMVMVIDISMRVETATSIATATGRPYRAATAAPALDFTLSRATIRLDLSQQHALPPAPTLALMLPVT